MISINTFLCLPAQPPGVPEICRKSISSCSVAGGEEMFIFGKNFLKDTVVVFQQNSAKVQPIWEEKVLPDKDSLQPVSGHKAERHDSASV